MTDRSADPIRDPVCGMTVDPARAAGHVEHNGTTYYFCSKGCVAKFTADPDRYLSGHRESMAPAPPQLVTIGGLKAHSTPAPSPRARPVPSPPAPSPQPRHEIHMPYAPRSRQRPARAHARSAAWRSSRWCRRLSDAPNPELVDMTRRFWVGVALGAPVFLVAMGDMMTGGGAVAADWDGAGQCAADDARDAGRPLVRRAVLRAHVAVVRQPKPEHVHADRPRRRRRVRVQRGRDARARRCFPRASGCTAASKRTSTRPSSSRCSCCSGR